jgi:hypothetical protein
LKARDHLGGDSTTLARTTRLRRRFRTLSARTRPASNPTEDQPIFPVHGAKGNKAEKAESCRL